MGKGVAMGAGSSAATMLALAASKSRGDGDKSIKMRASGCRTMHLPARSCVFWALGGRSRVLPHVFLRGSKSRDVAAGCK